MLGHEKYGPLHQQRVYALHHQHRGHEVSGVGEGRENYPELKMMIQVMKMIYRVQLPLGFSRIERNILFISQFLYFYCRAMIFFMFSVIKSMTRFEHAISLHVP